MKKLIGVITAMTTPFDENGKVDIAAIEQQTEFLIENGVNCLYPTGTTGEMYLMSSEERELVAETVVKKAAERITVYIHTGAMSQEETIRLSKHAYKIGADGVGIVTPSYFHLNDRAIVEYYKDICNTLPDNFPVYAYAIPQLAHNDITPECMNEICKACPNVVGIKYSFSDFRRIMAYMNCNNGNFSVVCGADDMFLPALAAGADGTVSGCSGPFPEPFVEIYKKYLERDIEGAAKAQRRANELIFLMKGGADMSIFKNILTFRGIRGGHVRKPLLDLSEADVQKLREDLRKWIP